MLTDIESSAAQLQQKLNIPYAAVTAILEVIEHPTQEGGWKLTEDKNDPDGGWTFAGVTSKTWAAHFDPATHAQMADCIENASDNIQEAIIEIYYKEFYLPAQAVIRNVFKLDAAILNGAELSCAVNIGLPHFETVVNQWADSDTSYADEFCYHWMHYYIDLVKKNAEAWREACESAQKNCNIYALQNTHTMLATLAPPHTLRAEFLSGWFNRIEHWRQGE